MKKNRLLILTFLLFFSLKAISQPVWNVNPGSYSYNMTITGAVNLNYTESTDPNDMVGAFIGGECRGVQNLVYNNATKRYIAYLMIYSNEVSGTINFKVYDASANAEIDIPVTKEFEINGIIGNTEAPYIWSNPTLSSEAEILTFGISGQSGSTTLEGTNISLKMPFGTDLTSLVADFTTSPYARVQIEGVNQNSGITANDFSAEVQYDLRSADETTQKSYTVTVTHANAEPTDIHLSANSIEENTEAGTKIGILTTDDLNTDDTHTYALVAGTGDTDNASFELSGDTLRIQTVPDYESQTSYSVRVQTDDGQGGVFEKQFTISVTDLNDETPQLTSAQIALPEDYAPRIVQTMQATDADVSPEFRELSFHITNGNQQAKFEIDTISGEVSLIADLDYETTTRYELEITVSDGVHSSTGVLKVEITDLNDETPQVEPGSVQISETMPPGEEIDRVRATDADANSTLDFSISGGNTGSAFSIDPITGIISLEKPLNFEETPVYELEITVSDGLNAGKGTFTIQLIDFDESQFSATNTISPNHDGINDYWYVEKASAYRNFIFRIFDNTGQIIYQSRGYNNDWDGTYNDRQLPIGVYYYTVKSETCSQCQFSGTISLIR